MMRVDDMLDTVMARAGVSASLRAVGWQQLVDLLSRQADAEGEVVDRAYRALEEWRPDTTLERRTRACAAAADSQLPARLFAHLVQDDPAVCAPVLTRSHVSDDAMIAELPRLSGPARSLLRHRSPMSSKLERALDAFGPGDRALADHAASGIPMAFEPVAAPSAGAPVPIREMVERIDRFRRSKPRLTPTPTPTPERGFGERQAAVLARGQPVRRDRFAFETGRDGAIRWTDAPQRGAVLGLSLAESAGEGIGVDSLTAARFARRGPIQAASLQLPVASAIGGAWTLDATPVFAPADGRFVGYVGSAQRAGSQAPGERWALSRSDEFRQLMHELKTPLNAVIGFAELIGEQLLGPLPADYRAQAARVRRDGQDVLAVLEDVDLAARLDAGSDALDVEERAGCDLAAVTAAVLDEAGTSSPWQTQLDGERPVAASATAARRLVDRLLTGLAPLAGADERLTVAITGRKWARLRASRPAALDAVPADDLQALRLPPALDSAAAPLLGLEFTLRLVRRLAEELGGDLSVSADEFILSLPVGRQDEVEHRR